MIQSHVDHRWGHARECDAFAQYKVEEPGRLEFFDDYVSSTHSGHRVANTPTVAVKLRERMQVNIVLVDAKFTDRVDCIDIEVAMGEHHPLRTAGSSRSVQQRRSVVLVYFDSRRWIIGCFRQERFVIFPTT